MSTLPWVEPSEAPASPELQAAVGGHPLVAQTLAQRGLADPAAARAFLDPDLYQPAPALDLPGMDAAARRLLYAVRRGEPIGVWGDFDVDGQTSTALLVACLRELGGRVSYHVPVRAAESHGVNLPGLQKILDAGARVILTCDTGSAAHDAVAYAAGRGVDTVITDHHELPPSLPAAYALVNPKLLPPAHPLAALPGVGVAYKLAEELGRRSGRPDLADRHLDLAALGIVADVATLTGDTRWVLQRGLKALRRGERLGLRVVHDAAGLKPDALTEEHIAFALAPRLNAVGRLADANIVVDLLSTDDLTRARIAAADIETLNARRKLLCGQVEAAAEAQLARDRSLLDDAALVLAGPAWPAGVIGIVAARLVERYGKPVVLIAAPPGEAARGSARSVEGINITAAIAAQSGLLLGFGGHPMAAGLSIAPERIPEFRRALARTVAGMAAPERPGLPIAAYLPLAELTPALARDLERLAPFGPGNRALVLASRNLGAIAKRAVGRGDEHLLVTVEDAGGIARQVIWWGGAAQGVPEGRFDLAYTLRASDYAGGQGVQVTWAAARPAEAQAVELRPAPAVTVADLRAAPDSHAALADIQLGLPGLLVWREAADQPGLTRSHLRPAAALAIWTSPPGPAELRAALEVVQPQQVYLFGVDPGTDQPQAFLARLAGLVKHARRVRDGCVTLADLAEATAQRLPTVRLGLAWLAARGHITILSEGAAGEWALAEGSGAPTPALAEAAIRLEAALAETAAYRAYFRRATPAPVHLAA